MSTSLTTLIRLRAIQNKILRLFDDMDDHTYRHQYHTDLSPLGWHLGHCVYTENYWLHEVVQKDNRLTRKQEKLYVPENCPKPERGGKLPAKEDLLSQAHEHQDNNDLLLLEMEPPLSKHRLFDDEYLQNFLIQHYAQHYETMQMILQQKYLQETQAYQCQTPLISRTPSMSYETVAAGVYEMGEESALAYDNELPPHPVGLASFNIASRPVSNGEYLAFIEADGYTNQTLWSEAGWQWQQSQQVQHPEHWKRDTRGDWYMIRDGQAMDIPEEQPVYGISYYEACAYARWARARLPHEFEWEAAVRNQQCPNTGKVWEWCDNTFFPYPGFRAFPYDGYSRPWFDENHYVLRGGSAYTRPEIRRASFRNFFNPDKRHIFAGLRLVFESDPD